MKPMIITNNPKVLQEYSGTYSIRFVEGGYMDVLTTIRDLVHKGHILLTHPLSGSIKPNETPYKSGMVSLEKESLNMDSLVIIEGSISTTKKFLEMKKLPRWPERNLEDFSEIDYTLLDSAIGSMQG